MKQRGYRQLTLIYMAVLAALPVYAEPQTDDKPDIGTITRGWKCKYCPDFSEKHWDGYVSAGAGYVSNDSYKFGEYNGLNEKGAYLGVDFGSFYRDEEGNYWDFHGKNLGQDIPYIGVEGGRQGLYKLNLVIDQITHYTLDTSRTPYSGDSTQTLPSGWVNAATTAGFATLASDLRDINFSTQRRSFVLSGEYVSSPQWSYAAMFKRQTKEGNRPVAFGFGLASGGSAILSNPVDYTTDDIELKANYHAGKFNGQIALFHSKFENANKFFRWDNAYDTPVGAPQGQAGTEPDNSKQQILLTGNYLGIKDVQFTGLFSYAQLSQDGAFLPYTVNSALTPPALPQGSLNGKVEVINTNVAAHWKYSPAQDWHASFEHHEQDNSTARNTYTYVIADDSLPGTSRANMPYGFRQQKLKVETDYKFDGPVKLSGGGQLSRFDRTYQSVETTEEAGLWAKLKHRIDNKLQYSIKGEFSDRSIDNYHVASGVTPADNPLMRKYNMADRQGKKAEINLSYAASDGLSVTISGDVGQYDYSDTSIGLTESDEFSAGVDMQYVFSKDLNFTGFVHSTNIKSQQAGSQAYSTADWTADNDDNVLTVGIGSNYQVIENKLKLGLDYVHAASSAAITVSTGGPLPDLTTKRDTITLYADYSLEKNLSVKASYQYEKYDESDWYIDYVAPDTLSNVLAPGNTSPHYKIGVFWITMRYTY